MNELLKRALAEMMKNKIGYRGFIVCCPGYTQSLPRHRSSTLISGEGFKPRRKRLRLLSSFGFISSWEPANRCAVELVRVRVRVWCVVPWCAVPLWLWLRAVRARRKGPCSGFPAQHHLPFSLPSFSIQLRTLRLECSTPLSSLV